MGPFVLGSMSPSVVDVAGVVDGVDEPTCDEFRVEDDWRCATPLPLAWSPFVWLPGYCLSSFPCLVEGRLLLRCNF